LLLAAGSGSRMGQPKALLRDPASGVTFLEHAVHVLREGGCDGVTVVVGAAAQEVRAVAEGIGPDVQVVDCPGWSEGMGASLRAGLAALEGSDVEAVVVTLVDLPDVGPEVVRRLLEGEADLPTALGRAAYGGVPGHPALIGRDHWTDAITTAIGDSGAREHFRTHPHRLVEVGDLATGRDVDTPTDLDTRT
jgi:CTP:molybdopterin cytidylyltransferase MocA